MQFRQKALAKMQTLEKLDEPLRLARPQSWLVLAVLAAVVVAGGGWAVTGSLPRKLGASGVLTHLQGSFTLQSPVAGQITSVFVAQGSTFPNATPLLSVQTPKQVEIVRTISAGRATAVLAKVGQIVSAGTPLAVVERIDDASDRLVAVLYAPGVSPPMVPVGSAVDLTVQSVSAQQFGVLRGRVASVGQFPENRQQVAEFLGDDQLGERFTADGQPLKIVVDLRTAPDTPSGYAWSSTTGPPFRIDSRTMVTGAIHLAAVRPISWVISS
jgi:biotin carboxyl carrier protein